jgi:hypothetical protein
MAVEQVETVKRKRGRPKKTVQPELAPRPQMLSDRIIQIADSIDDILPTLRNNGEHYHVGQLISARDRILRVVTATRANEDYYK